VKLVDAALAVGVRRYMMISSIGADRPHVASGSMRPYLEANAEADRYLLASRLEYTIVRPGSLTDDPGAGRVRVSRELGGRGEVPRDDVAAVIAQVLDAPNTIGVTFELVGGSVAAVPDRWEEGIEPERGGRRVVGHDLIRSDPGRPDRLLEAPTRRLAIPPRRDLDIDDLPELVDGAVHRAQRPATLT
jgi:uncharacterized protein YbjT (DUF2867 family)